MKIRKDDLMKEFNYDFENEVAEVNNWGSFIEYVLDSMAFPEAARCKIAERLLHHKLDDSEQPFIISLIVPLVECYPVVNCSYLWASDLVGIDETIAKDVSDYIHGGNNLNNMMRVNLSATDIIQILSMLSDSVDMKAG